jgi:hypothetical protein
MTDEAKFLKNEIQTHFQVISSTAFTEADRIDSSDESLNTFEARMTALALKNMAQHIIDMIELGVPSYA